ncbi:MAG: potassium channel family protein [Acidobacteriota bacterium]|nr:potassium channel family protein [Acidobacteriota bacterium]
MAPSSPGGARGGPSTAELKLFRDVDDVYDVADPADLSFRERVDWYLNEPASTAGRAIEVVVGALILAICALFILSTLDLPAGTMKLIGILETGITVIFLVEYLVRWWAKGFSLLYLVSPMALIDGAAILPLFLGPQLQLVRVLRLLRFFRLLRLVQSRKFFFGEVTPEHLIVLRIVFTVVCLVFVTGGTLYELEHEAHPETWPTLFDGIYFAVVTLTTVGFGDMTPHTLAGKIVTMVMILVGVLMIPWQLTTLARRVLFRLGKVRTTCERCGLTGHDPDASHCKSCGHIIYQEYEGDV